MINMIKLTNGDTIVGKIVNETDKHLSIEDPLEVRMSYADRYPSLVASYWIPLSEGGEIVDIRQGHVVVISDVNEEVKGYYERTLTRLSDKRHESIREVDDPYNNTLEKDNEDLQALIDYINYRKSANNGGGDIH